MLIYFPTRKLSLECVNDISIIGEEDKPDHEDDDKKLKQSSLETRHCLRWSVLHNAYVSIGYLLMLYWQNTFLNFEDWF